MRKVFRIKSLMICAFISVFICMSANAQIGYQISLLNTATGEARANETVKVTATITDSSGGVVWSGTQSVTSNDFGVLSLTVGNANTFKDLDLQQHRLPFFIEVSANGAMIGKSQILSVPVAEIAKRLEPLNVEDVVGTWEIEWGRDTYTLTFSPDMKVRAIIKNGMRDIDLTYDYIIDGNEIIVYGTSQFANVKPYYVYSRFYVTYRIINGHLYENNGTIHTSN